MWGEEEGGPLWGGETFRLHHLHNILQTADHSPSPSPPRPHPCQPSPCVTMTKPPPHKAAPQHPRGSALGTRTYSDVSESRFCLQNRGKRGKKKKMTVRRALTNPRLSWGHDGQGRGTQPGVPVPWLGWGDPHPERAPPTHTPSLRQHMRWPRSRQSSTATTSGTSSVTRNPGSRSWGGASVGGWKSPSSSSTPEPHTGPEAVGVGQTCSCNGVMVSGGSRVGGPHGAWCMGWRGGMRVSPG